MVGCMGGCIVKDGWVGRYRMCLGGQIMLNFHLIIYSPPRPQNYANQQTRQSLHTFSPHFKSYSWLVGYGC